MVLTQSRKGSIEKFAKHFPIKSASARTESQRQVVSNVGYVKVQYFRDDSMGTWRCSNCDTVVDEFPDVCWNCCASKDGREREIFDTPDRLISPAVGDRRQDFRFSLSTLLTIVTLSSLLTAIYANSPRTALILLSFGLQFLVASAGVYITTLVYGLFMKNQPN